MASYVRSISAASTAATAIVLLRGASGKPAAILPFERVRRGGIVTLRTIGGKHASFHLPLTTPEGCETIIADPLSLLRAAATAAGNADLIVLSKQPARWEGEPNPFARLGTILKASAAYQTVLPREAEAFIIERNSADARKKLRKKRQALAKLGPVAAMRPSTPEDVERTLLAFFDQKRRRFAVQGVANPFTDAPTQAFLRSACMSVDGEPPAIELQALSCGERIVAVFGLATGFSRASGMFTSFEDEPAIARCSPGDILLHDMIRDLIARGFARFDLGVGEARYKNAFCHDEVPLVDAYVPLTAYGWIAAAAVETVALTKAVVKRDPRLLNAAKQLSVALRRFGRPLIRHAPDPRDRP